MAKRAGAASAARKRLGGRVRNEAGFALPVAMFSLIIMAMIAMSSMVVSTGDREASWASVAGERAHYAAQAGAHQVWANWPAAADALLPGDTLDLGWTTLPDRSRFRARITRVDSGGVQELRVLRVEGRSAGIAGGQRVVELWTTQGANVFPNAIGAGGNLLIDNDAIVDSYDSGVGVYGGANINSNGDVHADGNTDITNNSTVSGAASAAGVTTTATGGVATGGITSGVPPRNYPPVHCPTGPYTRAADLPPGLYAYNEFTGNLTIDNTALLLPAGVYYFNDVVVAKNNGHLAPIPGNDVVVHIEGTLTTQQQGKINNLGLAPEFLIFGCGPATHSWSFNQNSQVYAGIYAPMDDIVVENDSDVFGSVVGRDVTVWKGGTGPVSVHYDEQLNSLSAGGARRQLLRPWAQIAR